MREGYGGLYLRQVDGVFLVVLGIGVSLEYAHFPLEPVLHVSESHLVHREDAVLCACLDSHVSHAEPVLHGEVFQSLAHELHRAVERTVNTYHADDVQDNVLSCTVLGQLAHDVELDSRGHLEPSLALSHAGAHIGGAYPRREGSQSAVGAGVAVRPDDAVSGSHKPLLGQQSVLYAHSAHVVEVSYLMFSAEVPALLALGSSLDVLVRSEVIHDHGHLFLVEDLGKACFVELVDSNRRGDVVAENEVKVSHYQLSCLYLIEPCMSREDLLCHRHSHSILVLS